jgi:membrane-associated phospholipid phosphatase
MFNLELIQFLADSRIGLLTALFLFCSFMGETEGYVLVVTGIYVMYDKALAYRLSALVLLTMCVNHAMKTFIRNPRPFIDEGTWAQKWAVPAENARELATEYSTPSGHGMAGGAFYGHLYASVKRRGVRIIAVLAILATGLSRPYLGVHYLEDILLGWLIGISLALVLFRYGKSLGRLWQRRSYAQQVTIVVGFSAALWLVTVAAGGWRIDAQPLAFIGYSGFLTGLVIAHPLEIRRVDFDPRSGQLAHKLLRYALSVAMVIGTLFVLDELFAALADDVSLLGHILRYARYIAAGIVAMWLAPLVFTRLGLAERRAALGSVTPETLKRCSQEAE